MNLTRDQGFRQTLVSISQDIPLWGKRGTRTDVATAEADASKARERSVAKDLEERVKVTFAQYYEADHAMRGAAMRHSGHPVMQRILIAGAALSGALAAASALYHYGSEFVTGRSNRQPVVTALAPVDTGSISSEAFKFSFFNQPRALPELRFIDGEGHASSLADFRGRPVLLNIWATWCAPCRKEMPAPDRLQAAIDKSQLLVLPLSIDRQGAPVVKQFYQGLGLKALGICQGVAHRRCRYLSGRNSAFDGRKMGVDLGGQDGSRDSRADLPQPTGFERNGDYDDRLTRARPS